jgi:hypothetical protein
MYVVVIDCPAKWGTFLSKKWAVDVRRKYLGGLQDEVVL